jgi:RNA polymerase-binding transcription factor DksA
MRGTLMTADLAIPALRASAGRCRAAEVRHLHPVAPARHLHPAALPQWHALLGLHWQERLERVTELSLAYHEAQEAAADISRRPAARLAARRLAAGILHRAVAERRVLAEIDAALARLAIGRFGWCEQCGAAVATATLTETPQARYCAACDH